MKKLGLLLLTLLLVVSCGRDPKGTVDKFIKNVQTKNSNKQQNMLLMMNFQRI